MTMASCVVKRRELMQALGALSKMICRSIFIKAVDSQVTLAATDYSFWALARLPRLDGGSELFTRLVPADALARYVRARTADRVRIGEGEDKFVTRLDDTFTIVGSDPDEYPQPPDLSQAEKVAELSLYDLRHAVAQVAFAVSKDKKWRPITVGLHLELRPNRAHVVATDGHRLAIADFAPIHPPCEKLAFTIPVKALQVATLISDGGRLTILSSGEWVVLRSEAGEVYCTPIEGTYPSWRTVTPKPKEPFWRVDIRGLREALKKVEPAVDHDRPVVRLSFSGGKLKVSAKTDGLGEVHAETAVEGTAEAKALFNPKFLKDYLTAVKDCKSVRVQLPEGKYRPSRWDASPCHIYLLMPIQETN